MSTSLCLFAMSEGEDYEALPSSSRVSAHMIAGAAAGIMEHSIMYPVDVVKTRMQSLEPNPKTRYKNVFDALHRIARYEGIGNSLRGINAVIYGAGPAHAMYFAVYEEMKNRLTGSQRGQHLSNGLAGCFATVVHDVVMNPAEVVKQRMQIYDSPYKTCSDAFLVIAKREGVLAFYRSFTTQLAMNIPFQSIHFMVYEFCQDSMNYDREYSPGTHIASGGCAGGVAAAITTPLDRCKTLLNTQEKCAVSKGGTVSGLFQAIKTVYQFRGFSGFMQGVSARVIFQAPSTAISWSVYEFFKFFLTTKTNNTDCDGQYISCSAVTEPIIVAKDQ